jgi:hypothetical protein
MQFGVGLKLSDSELQTLERTISHYSRVCRREIRKGGSVPFIAHSLTFKQFRKDMKKQLEILGEIIIGDCEIIALRAAFSSYLEACEQNDANAAIAPFVADRATVKRLAKRMIREWHRVVFDQAPDWLRGRQRGIRRGDVVDAEEMKKRRKRPSSIT